MKSQTMYYVSSIINVNLKSEYCIVMSDIVNEDFDWVYANKKLSGL